MSSPSRVPASFASMRARCMRRTFRPASASVSSAPIPGERGTGGRSIPPPRHRGLDELPGDLLLRAWLGSHIARGLQELGEPAQALRAIGLGLDLEHAERAHGLPVAHHGDPVEGHLRGPRIEEQRLALAALRDREQGPQACPAAHLVDEALGGARRPRIWVEMLIRRALDLHPPRQRTRRLAPRPTGERRSIVRCGLHGQRDRASALAADPRPEAGPRERAPGRVEVAVLDLDRPDVGGRDAVEGAAPISLEPVAERRLVADEVLELDLARDGRHGLGAHAAVTSRRAGWRWRA